ncbi:thioredoxin family protein [Ligilactobacillus sp. LYQ135]
MNVNDIDILVLGTGCPKCKKLAENTKQAIKDANLENKQFKYVTDPVLMAQLGIMSSPALLVNGKVMAKGELLSPEEIVKIFKKNNLL